MTRRSRVVASPARAQTPPDHQAFACRAVGLEEPHVHHLSPMTTVGHLRIATSRPSPAIARIDLVGEVDLANAPELRDRLLAMLHDHDPDLLDVDLGGVTFLDCTGLGALIGARNAAVNAGRQLRVLHPQPFVRRILEVTGLLDVFTAAATHPRS